MGCTSSKQVEAAVAADVYRLPPTSIAVFDINTIEEPWLITTKTTTTDDEEKVEEVKKPIHVPLPILEKLETGVELAPNLSWSEVSKALQDIKPSLENPPKPKPVTPHKSISEPRKSTSEPPPELTARRPVKENSFILRDRQERESNKAGEANKIKWLRPDPLAGYLERIPPGNPDGVVLYTTTLRGVRRTFEDCEWARRVVYPCAMDAGVAMDERDVSLHGEFLKEVRDMQGEGGGVPRLFVMGRYIGGIEKMVELNENGKMREMMRWVSRRGGRVGEGKGGWGDGCEGCGGVRFVPCLECSGSCKVVGEDGKEVVRCGKCNENGLVLCPLCH